MKLIFLSILAPFLLMACNNAPKKKSAHQLTGEWDAHLSHEGKPYVVTGRFKKNADYDAFIDDKLIISGKYRIGGDTAYFRDGQCNMDYEGLYRITYWADSVRFDVLQDTCRERVNGSNGMAMRRIKD